MHSRFLDSPVQAVEDNTRWQQPVSISRYAPDAHYASPSMQHPGLTSPRFSIFFFFSRGLVSWPPRLLSSWLGSVLHRVAPRRAPRLCANVGDAHVAAVRATRFALAARIPSPVASLSTWPSAAGSAAALCWKIYRSPPRYFPFRPGFLPADRITRRVGCPWLRHLSCKHPLIFFLFSECVFSPPF